MAEVEVIYDKSKATKECNDHARTPMMFGQVCATITDCSDEPEESKSRGESQGKDEHDERAHSFFDQAKTRSKETVKKERKEEAKGAQSKEPTTTGRGRTRLAYLFTHGSTRPIGVTSK